MTNPNIQNQNEKLASTQNRLIEELQFSEKRYSDLVAHLNDVVFHLDEKLCWTYLNKAWYKITGHLVKASLGHDLSEYIQCANSLFTELLEGNKQELRDKFVLICANGHHRTVEISCRPMKDATGQLSSIIGTLSDITEQLAQQQQIYHMAYHDSLTGLANRRQLIDLLQVFCDNKQAYYAALLYLDLDGFKQINDTHGHTIGDELLLHTASLLKKITDKIGVPTRIGGDEFIVFLPELPDEKLKAKAWLQQLADTIRHQLMQETQLNHINIQASCSIGIMTFKSKDFNTTDLLKHADFAMYQAKHDGRNLVRFYNKRMATQEQRRIGWEQELRLAIEAKEFMVLFQPQVNIISGKVTKAEALVRWQHPKRGLVMPKEFISNLESIGLLSQLDDQVFDFCCAQLQDWRSMGHADFCLSINVSPRDFQDTAYAGKIAQKLEAHNIPGHAIEIEINEGIALQNIASTIETMHQLRRLGVKIALDDFGSRYSSLSHLRILPITTIKLDSSFIQRLPQDVCDRAIVEFIIALSRQLRFDTVAEGVKTAEQLNFLREKGCTNYQGSLYSPAIKADLFKSFLN
ncbi:MAG: diguanylate cyclase (GGDEF)-like protein/PAS domain S-box-containing protein [Methylophagaceae bacterium]|jgi:diguanylate cyclase (GGDEF)-like protein/PAS domain S-box-containing protein